MQTPLLPAPPPSHFPSSVAPENTSPIPPRTGVPGKKNSMTMALASPDTTATPDNRSSCSIAPETESRNASSDPTTAIPNSKNSPGDTAPAETYTPRNPSPQSCAIPAPRVDSPQKPAIPAAPQNARDPANSNAQWIRLCS